jgi:transaldolase
MKFFLDSAKLDEIDLAYNTFGIDGVTTNPRHVQASGKPFKVALRDISAWLKDHGLTGYAQFPVSVEINPHLSAAADMMREARIYAALNPCFVVKLRESPRRASWSAMASAPMSRWCSPLRRRCRRRRTARCSSRLS